MLQKAKMFLSDIEHLPDWGWLRHTLPNGETHVLPINDEHDHELSPDCWCEPDDEDYCWSHNSCDGREDYEQGLRKPH